MNTTIFWVVIVVLALLVIVLLIWNGLLIVRRIDPSTCPTVGGLFGVQTNMQGTVMNRCGATKLDPCVFTVADLTGAISQCNALIDVCDTFTYTHGTRAMAVVDPTTVTGEGTEELYTRQYPKTQP